MGKPGEVTRLSRAGLISSRLQESKSESIGLCPRLSALTHFLNYGLAKPLAALFAVSRAIIADSETLYTNMATVVKAHATECEYHKPPAYRRTGNDF